VETRPFDAETYEDEIDEEETLDEEGRARYSWGLWIRSQQPGSSAAICVAQLCHVRAAGNEENTGDSGDDEEFTINTIFNAPFYSVSQ